MGKSILVVLLFFSCLVWSAPSVKKLKKPLTKEIAEEITNLEKEEEENFTPSLSETLSNTNRLKSKIKRQLAQELSTEQKDDIAQRSPEGEMDVISADEIAQFGDFEVGISKRGEEELVEVKTK